jgi:ubiquinone biosynthesis protein
MSTMRAVYSNLRAARTTIRDVGRMRQIVEVCVRHGLGHVVEAWNLQDKRIVGLLVDRAPVDDAAPHTMFERIAAALQDLGPTFVKLGQILSTRPDLIPQELCDQFKTLQDNVRPITLAEARAMVEAELGAEVWAQFEHFEETPLASASIAQVHTARLTTGEEVVVKIQRPGIGQTIESDLNILYFVAKKLEETVPEAKAFNPVSIAGEFEKAIKKELDFTTELRHAERFARNFADWPTVHIPAIHRSLSTSRVLVMERLHGVKITEAAAHGHDMPPIARETVRALFKMSFEDGFFHGDLHPGNIFILEDGRIGFIDFGLVGRMTATMKDAMADLLLAVVRSDYEGVARSFYDISIRSGKVDFAAFEADTVDLMEQYFDNITLSQVDFGGFLQGLVEGAIRHDVRVPPEYTMLFKALMTVEGIGKAVAPDLDLISECRPYVQQLVAERYGPERVLKATADTLNAFGRFARQFPITANEFLGAIDDGRLSVALYDPQQTERELAADRRLNRGALMALAVGLLVCGAVMSDQEGTFSLLGIPGTSLICFALGGALAGRLWWRIYLSGRW